MSAAAIRTRPYTAGLVSQRPALGCLFEIVETLVLTLLIFFVIQNFVAQPYKVQQKSMQRTLEEDQYVLVDKLTPRWDAYDRGDIVVFEPPDEWGEANTPFIKRVIGEPGDTVEIRDDGLVYINGTALEKIDSYTQIGKDDGAMLLTGGEIADEGDLAKGFYYRPTIFGDVEHGMRIAQEEIFGPTLSLIRFRDEAEAFRISNGIRYGLSSSIFTRDVNRAFRAMRDLEAGITYINAGTIGAEVHLPFGGTKETGNGHREAGQAALDVFTEWKSVYVDYSGTLQRAQIDNSE